MYENHKCTENCARYCDGCSDYICETDFEFKDWLVDTTGELWCVNCCRKFINEVIT